MANDTLIKTAFAVLFGAISLAVPEVLTMFNVTTIILIQVSALVVSGYFISNIIVSRDTAGYVSIASAFLLIATGFIVAGNIGTQEITQVNSVDNTFDSNFNGTLSGDMIIDGTYLTLSSTTASGTYQSDVIYENGSTNFNRIVVDMNQIETDDTVQIRMRTYEDASLADVHTYNISEKGLTDLNVSKINSPTEINSYDWQLQMESTSAKAPEFDSIRFESEVEERTNTTTSGIVQFIPFLIFVMGGLIVAALGVGGRQ